MGNSIPSRAEFEALLERVERLERLLTKPVSAILKPVVGVAHGSEAKNDISEIDKGSHPGPKDT